MPTYRIYPSIGVARMGNSEEFFIGPETPGIPANWNIGTGKFEPFKDSAGRVKRQAARFRIFEFDDAGNPTKEITLSEARRIEWRVHVANRKSSFFTFNGQRGTETNPPYAGRATEPADKVEKELRGRGQPQRLNLRNAGVSNRRALEIDPGERSVSEPGATVDLIDTATPAPIKNLGKIQMEPDGRLLFLGGQGNTASSAAKPPQIDEYANNDTWFDDASDGTIRAQVTLPDGSVVDAEQAWIIVGPPDFAPGLGNVVSLYDTAWDIAVRFKLDARAGNDPMLKDLVAQQEAWQPATNDFSAAYTPSFTQHIYPILARALGARDTHASARPAYHASLSDWVRLSNLSETNLRTRIFKFMRDPNSEVPDWYKMPRGLGDDFASLDEFESGKRAAPSARAFLSQTRVQYALLKAWAEGRFKSDWPHGGDVRFAPIPNAAEITPHGLEIAAMENCVGGPFFPGIEVGWLIRETALYRAAFRLKDAGLAFGPLTLGAGFFSQQMAQPWTADFYDCHKEDHTPEGAEEPIEYMWWTAQRPDDIRPNAESALRRWVEPFDAAREDQSAEDGDDITNLTRFEQMRTRWSELSFLVLEGEEYVEQK